MDKCEDTKDSPKCPLLLYCVRCVSNLIPFAGTVACLGETIEDWNGSCQNVSSSNVDIQHLRIMVPQMARNKQLLPQVMCSIFTIGSCYCQGKQPVISGRVVSVVGEYLENVLGPGLRLNLTRSLTPSVPSTKNYSDCKLNALTVLCPLSAGLIFSALYYPKPLAKTAYR